MGKLRSPALSPRACSGGVHARGPATGRAHRCSSVSAAAHADPFLGQALQAPTQVRAPRPCSCSCVLSELARSGEARRACRGAPRRPCTACLRRQLGFIDRGSARPQSSSNPDPTRGSERRQNQNQNQNQNPARVRRPSASGQSGLKLPPVQPPELNFSSSPEPQPPESSGRPHPPTPHPHPLEQP
jgi:hypothetical protein